jgi:hypothetical protein
MKQCAEGRGLVIVGDQGVTVCLQKRLKGSVDTLWSQSQSVLRGSSYQVFGDGLIDALFA